MATAISTIVPSSSIQLGLLGQQFTGQAGARQLNAITQGTGAYWNPNDGGHISSATPQKMSNFKDSSFYKLSGQLGTTTVTVSQSTNGYVTNTGTLGGVGGALAPDSHLPSPGLIIGNNTNQYVYVNNSGTIYGGGGGGGYGQGPRVTAQALQAYVNAQAGATGLITSFPTTFGYLYNTGSIYGGCGGGGCGYDAQDNNLGGGGGGAANGIGGPATGATHNTPGGNAATTTGGTGSINNTGQSGAGGSFTPGPQAGQNGLIVGYQTNTTLATTPGGAVGTWMQGFTVMQAGTHN